MRYVIVDCGPVGRELARRWAEAGHRVVGTTPDPTQLPAVQAVCAEAEVVSHDDAERIREVVAHADCAVLANRPQLLYARSPRDQAIAYRRSMIPAVRAAASVQRRLVLLSNIVVFGSAGGGDGPVTELTPVTRSLDIAAQCFAAVERMVLESPEAAVLRLPAAVVGHPDGPEPDQVLRALWAETGGSLPFDGGALAYLIDFRDAAAAVDFTVTHQLAGVFNTVPDATTPPRVDTFLGKLAADAGLPPPELTGAITAPTRPISAAKLRTAGFEFCFS
jgi:nucleoside-diphosphate-sugar epimerase